MEGAERRAARIKQTSCRMSIFKKLFHPNRHKLVKLECGGYAIECPVNTKDGGITSIKLLIDSGNIGSNVIKRSSLNKKKLLHYRMKNSDSREGIGGSAKSTQICAIEGYYTNRRCNFLSAFTILDDDAIPLEEIDGILGLVEMVDCKINLKRGYIDFASPRRRVEANMLGE